MPRHNRSQHLENLHQELGRALKYGLPSILMAFLREKFPREAAVIVYFLDRFSSTEVLKWAAMLERDMSFRTEFGAITQKTAITLVERGAARIGIFDGAVQGLRSLHAEFLSALIALLPETRENEDPSELHAELEALKQSLSDLETEKQTAVRKATQLEKGAAQWRKIMKRVREICSTAATSPVARPLSELTYEFERGDEDRTRASVERLMKAVNFYKPDSIGTLKATRKELVEELEELKSRGNDLLTKGRETDANIAKKRGDLESMKASFENSQKAIEHHGREFAALSLAEDTDDEALIAKTFAITEARAKRASLKSDMKTAETELGSMKHEREQVDKEFDDLPSRIDALNELIDSVSTTVALLERRSGIVQFLEATVPALDVALLDEISQHLRVLSLHPRGFWSDGTTTTSWGSLVNLGAFTNLEDFVEAWLTDTFEDRIKALGEKAQTLGPSRMITRVRNAMTGISKSWKRAGVYQSALITEWIAAKAAAQTAK